MVVVNEYSQFPCKRMTSETVVYCLSQFFNSFSFPAYIHSNRGLVFVSCEVKPFLSARGIATNFHLPIIHGAIASAKGQTRPFGKLFSFSCVPLSSLLNSGNKSIWPYCMLFIHSYALLRIRCRMNNCFHFHDGPCLVLL